MCSRVQVFFEFTLKWGRKSKGHNSFLQRWEILIHTQAYEPAQHRSLERTSPHSLRDTQNYNKYQYPKSLGNSIQQSWAFLSKGQLLLCTAYVQYSMWDAIAIRPLWILKTISNACTYVRFTASWIFRFDFASRNCHPTSSSTGCYIAFIENVLRK